MSGSGKLCPKLILEGTRLTLKTDLAFALNEHPRLVGPRKYRYHSPLISAEWCAFTDGRCNLCSALVRFVIERDRAGRFRFAALSIARRLDGAWPLLQALVAVPGPGGLRRRSGAPGTALRRRRPGATSLP